LLSKINFRDLKEALAVYYLLEGTESC